MNFQSLKTMVDNLVQTYSCPNCQSGVEDSSVEVVGTAGTNVNVEIECPQCHKHTIVRAQVFSVDISASAQISDENIANIKNQLQEQHGESTDSVEQLLNKDNTGNKNVIKDEEIISLNRKLRNKNINISDLFQENNDA